MTTTDRRCRECGGEALDAERRSADVDPAPEVCERCLDPRLRWVGERLAAEVAGPGAMADVLERHFGRLVDAGLLPKAAALHVRDLCQQAGLPAPRVALAAADPAWERRVRAARATWLTGDD